jgi:shikimate 5-dehydrogenase
MTTTIDGRTKLIAHLGFPTETFKAPMIYNPYFKRHGINAVVVPMGCKAEDYAGFSQAAFQAFQYPRRAGHDAAQGRDRRAAR